MGENIRRLAREVRSVARQGPEAIALHQRAHVAEMVAYARANSPYYRELYQDLPARVDDVALLPVTDKRKLMGRFDDWVTDREVTQEKVERFVADPDLAGQRFLGRYLVATTSGTSGVRGLFVIDDRYRAVHLALGSRAGGVLGARDLLRMVTRFGRTAIVSAPGGHFFTVATAARYRLEHPRLGRLMRVFSIHQPLPELVAELNRYDPASIAGFLGMLTLLAGEQESGRLHIHPAVVVPGGETLTEDVRRRIATAFGATVRAAYAATECGFLAMGCAHDWYHVASDWAVAEPVDADYQPVPPGQPSHTVLVSNLANRVQPILRYDLGDSVLLRPDPCPCGSPFPAIRVQGRAADELTFPVGPGPAGRGEQVSISPMLVGTLLDRVAGVEQFQIVQTTPTTLRVRLRSGDGADTDRVWQAVRDEITQLLTEHKAGDVTLERAPEAPQQSPGGKFRRIIPLAKP